MSKKPVEYSEELALEICDVVSCTPDMLEEICEKYPHWPTAKTVYQWRIRYEKFGEMYARAKQCQIDPLVNTVITKARDSSNDFYHDEEGKKHINYAHLTRLRTELDNIKWFAAKLAPKIYGTKTIEIGAEGSLLEKFIDKL